MFDSTARAGFGFGLWLELDAATAERCRTWRIQLGGPPFEPHVTLAAHLTLAQARAQLHTLPAQRAPLWLHALRRGEPPYQALTLQVRDAQVLRTLRKAAGLPLDDYQPHVSLHYGAPPETLPAQVSTALPLRCYIAALAVWDLRGPVPTWQRLQSRELI